MTPKMAVDTKKASNVSSQLLTQEENQKVFLALGKQCTVCIFVLFNFILSLYLS